MKYEFDEGRYDRQLDILGPEGQEALSNSTATVVGLGGLGSPAATYLAAAGFGKLVLVDFDEVDLSNLNRQFLHGDSDRGGKKTDSGRERLGEINPEVELETLELELDEAGLEALPESDVVLGAVDDFPTRYLLNEYAVREKIPYVHGAVEGFRGQLTTVIPERTACLRCIFPESPPARGELQVLGTTAGVTGTTMANEAIKYVTGVGKLAAGEMLSLDLANNEFEALPVERSPDCPVCT